MPSEMAWPQGSIVTIFEPSIHDGCGPILTAGVVRPSFGTADVSSELEATAKADGNLLAAAVEAARARATVGEISTAMENVFGRHRAEVKTLAGVYGAAYEGDAGFVAKVSATAFADFGFDVDVGPLFQTPEEAAQDAIDNDVHVIGISSQAAGHKTLAPKLIEALTARDAGDILVICGGVIPQQDYDVLMAAGVKAIFGPGPNIPEAAADILKLIREARGV